MNKKSLSSIVQEIVELIEKKVLLVSNDKVYLNGYEIEHVQVERSPNGNITNMSMFGGEYQGDLYSSLNLLEATSIHIDENKNIILQGDDKTARLTFNSVDHELVDLVQYHLSEDMDSHYLVTTSLTTTLKGNSLEEQIQTLVKAPSKKLATLTAIAPWNVGSGLTWSEDGQRAECNDTSALFEAHSCKELTPYQYRVLNEVGIKAVDFEAIREHIPTQFLPKNMREKKVSATPHV